MEKIILLGGGGHCKSVIDVIQSSGRFKILGILDSNIPSGESLLEEKVLGDDSLLPSLVKECRNLHITVGHIRSNLIRKKIAEKSSELKISFPNVVSDRSHISKHCSLGHGVTVLHNATVQADTQIGNFTIINNHALVEHDVRIGNFCHISTGALVNGNVTIGDDVFIGSGAIIIQGTKIPSGTFIKAGQLVK